MVKVVPFKAEHVIYLDRQKHEGSKEEDQLKLSQFMAVEAAGRSKSIFIHGKVYACAGIVPYSHWRGAVWAIIDENAGDHFVSIVRTLKRLLDEVPERRIESTVVKSFEKGHKLNRVLGFTLEAPEMKMYGQFGTTHSLYSRIK